MESSFLLYLLKANLALVVLYILFILFFQRTTFHIANRVVLLFILIFSFLAPFLNCSFFSVNENALIFYDWVEHVDNFPVDWQNNEQIVSSTNTISVSAFLLLFYLIGVSIMLFRFCMQLKSIMDLKRKAFPYNRANNTYFTEAGNLPFTFLNWVFIPKKEYDTKKLDLILKHEIAHAKQWHTLDILFAELICIAFWFNPFVFSLKRSLKSVHEYLADSEAAKYKDEIVSFLNLLVEEVSYVPVKGLLSNFYWLTIKKRIKMITKNKTSRIRAVSYILIFPVLALMIQSFYYISIGNNIGLKSELMADSNIPSISPIQKEKIVRISSQFGMRMHPIYKVEKMHFGVDIVAETGTPVLASAMGEVVKIEFEEQGKGYGRMILIDHGNEYFTLYTQLSEFKVQVGDKIDIGDVVGLVGSSGLSTAPHLHYEVRKNGENVDPELYFKL